MKIHYFQRYHEKENVATANTMLLLSRLYQYSADKFYRLIKTAFFSDAFDPEIAFEMQKKSVSSVPDAIISQESFKIVVETKMSDWFYTDQLMRHLDSFNDEKYKLLLTLAPERMNQEKKKDLEALLKQYNTDNAYPVVHINRTFEEIANAIQEVIDEQDYEMKDVLDDYLSYCYEDGLIIVPDAWKYMRVQLAGTTFAFNLQTDLYYDGADRGFRPHDYLGLYKEKSVRAIGKINTVVVARHTKTGIEYQVERGALTEDHKEKILAAIEDGKNYGYVLDDTRYFFVDKFYPTNFKKTSPRAPMGSRIFDLTQVLNIEELPEVPQVAEMLTSRTWN